VVGSTNAAALASLAAGDATTVDARRRAESSWNIVRDDSETWVWEWMLEGEVNLCVLGQDHCESRSPSRCVIVLSGDA
jgi:hypothetical protein